MNQWEKIYQENSDIFCGCAKHMNEFVLQTKSGKAIKVIIEKKNGFFSAVSNLYPKASDAAGPYKPSNTNGATEDEAFKNLLRAWHIQYIGCDPSTIDWK